MPEDLGDFGEGRSVADHPACQTVPEQVSRTAVPTPYCGAVERAPHDMTNRSGPRKSHVGGYGPKEDPTRAAGASVLLNVESQRFPDVCRQRESVENPALPANDNLPGPPVNIAEVER